MPSPLVLPRLRFVDLKGPFARRSSLFTMQAKLTVIGGKANRKELSLNIPVIVGRSRGVGLTIAHPMVSRQHCEIFETDGALRIRDLGSTNGTFVGGKKVPEAVLRPHDQFSIGPLTFEIDYQYVGDATVVEEHYGDLTGGDARATSLAAEGAAVDDEAPPEGGFTPVSGGEPAEDAAFDFLGMASEPPAEAEAAPPDEEAVDAPPPAPMEFVEQPAEVSAEATEYYSPEEKQDFADKPPAAEEPEPAMPFPSFEPEAEVAPDFTAGPEAPVWEEDEAPIDEGSVDEIPVDPIQPADVAAWEAPDDVPPLDFEPAVPEETASLPTTIAPPPPSATEDEVVDFAAWSARQAGGAAAASPPEPVADPDLGMSEEPAADSRASPWESPVDDGDAPLPPPPVAASKPNPKKAWWPFGKGKGGGKTKPGPESRAPSPDLASFGDEQAPAVESPPEGQDQTAEPPLPPPQKAEGGSPTADDERQADLNDFLNGLG